jgi:hypothetical protein
MMETREIPGIRLRWARCRRSGALLGNNVHDGLVQNAPVRPDDDRAVYCSCQKQTSYTFRGYVLKRDVTKFQGYTLLAV